MRKRKRKNYNQIKTQIGWPTLNNKSRNNAKNESNKYSDSLNELRWPLGIINESKGNESIKSRNLSWTLTRNAKLEQILNGAETKPPKGGHTTTNKIGNHTREGEATTIIIVFSKFFFVGLHMAIG